MFDIYNLLKTLFLISIFLIIYNHFKNRRFWYLINKFNGNKTLPFVGNALELHGTAEAMYIKIIEFWEKHNRRTYKVQILNDVFLLICEPESAEVILNNNIEITKAGDYKFLKRWLGNGLLFSDGDKWRRQRKIITPAFHFKILEQFVGVFEEKGDVLIKKLSEKKDQIFDVHPLVKLCALDIICESAMGTTINAQENSESDYVKAVYSMLRLYYSRIFSVWKRFDFLYKFSSEYREEKRHLKILHGLTNKFIENGKMRIKNQLDKNDETKKVAFLDLLLLSKTPEGESLSDEVIREEVDTFMFEGHDTTTSCISFALYMLANNPDVQKLAFEEQLELFGNDLHKHANYSDLLEMKYLDRVIKETLRIFPSIPVYGRTLINDVKLPNGSIIPAETFAVLCPIYMGRNPDYFPNPMKFDPDRFLLENSQSRHPFLNVTFSAGPRNCIGQKFAILEIKSILSKVLRNYELFSSGIDLILTAVIVLRSTNGMKIRIRDRFYN